MEKNKKEFVVCGNGIAKIEERYKKKYAYSYSFNIFFDQNNLVCHVLLWQKKVEWNCGHVEIGGKKIYSSWFVAMLLPKLREKKLWEWICGNGIAEIGWKKKFVAIVLWQWHCRNREKIKKKVCIFLFFQYFFFTKIIWFVTFFYGKSNLWTDPISSTLILHAVKKKKVRRF